MNSRSTYEEEERRRQRRKEWEIQQELEREHEKRKLKMIEAYERQRAEKLKMESKSRQSKSASPHRRTTSTDKRSEESKVSSTLKSFKNINIDVKELHRIKVKIERTATDDLKTELEPSIDKSVDIILPRRKDEGSRPLFDGLVVSPTQSLTNKDSSDTSRGSSNYYNYNYNYYNYNNNNNRQYNNRQQYNNRYNNNNNNNNTRIHGRDNLQTSSTRTHTRTHVDRGSRLGHVDIRHQDNKRNENRYKRDRSRTLPTNNYSKREKNDNTDRSKKDYAEQSHRPNNRAPDYPAPRLSMNCPPYIHNFINYVPIPGVLPLIRTPLPFIPPIAQLPLNMPPYQQFLPNAPNMNAQRPRYKPKNHTAK